MGVTQEQLAKLSDVSVLDELNIQMKWRVGQKKNGMVSYLSYLDARDVSRILDHCLGNGNWSKEYHELKGSLFCRITVTMHDGSAIFHEDVGSESNVEKRKGEASDAFKRAAVSLGVNYAYDTGVMKFVERGDSIVHKETGVVINKWDSEAINRYCNNISDPIGLLYQLHKLIGKEVPSKVLDHFKGLKAYCETIK
jgi:hypothetical protein